MNLTISQISHGAIARAKLGLRSLGLSIDGISEDSAAERVATCLSCENLLPDKDGKISTQSQCSKCGCPIFDKARLGSERCPESRWPEHVYLGARGVGDALCGLYAACGMAIATGNKVVYHAQHFGWFDGISHPNVEIVNDGAVGTKMDPDYHGQIARADSRKKWYCARTADALAIPKFDPIPPAKVPTLKTFDWCNDTRRSDEPTVAVLICAAVKDERDLEMLQVQSLVRLHGFRMLTCAVIDYVAPRLLDDVMALDFTMGIFQKSPPTGIRRPTETGIRAIREVWGDVHILRVVNDSPIYDPDKLSADIIRTIGTQCHWVAGGIQEFHRQPSNPNKQALDALGIHKDRYEYVHGCLSFAPLATWEKYYCGLHPSITHYADDDVMSSWIVQDGGRLIGWEPSWKHEHGKKMEVFTKLLPSEMPTVHDKQTITLASKNDSPYVLLFPFTALHRRDWNNWRSLAQALIDSGRRVIAGCWNFEDELKRMFAGMPVHLLLQRPPAEVAVAILNASVIVANDSGMAHVGGMLGVSTVAIHAGSLPHSFLFDQTSTVKSVVANTNFPRGSERQADLETISVKAVMDAIDSFR